MRSLFMALLAVVGASVSPALCADLETPVVQATPRYDIRKPDSVLLRPDSIFIFAGAMSTDDLGSTAIFNLDSDKVRFYDNYVAGAAYNRDFLNLGYGFALGAEVGIADRFGKYSLCCDTIIKSSGLVHSGELWAGARLSYDGTVLFNAVKIGGALTTGISYTTNSIGREREREIGYGGSARILGYLGPEITFSLVDRPEFEFVYRVQHRSGAGGVIGKIREGYNANVFGVRYKF